MTINYNNKIKSLRDIVWGVVTNPLSQIEQITFLIFIKLLSEKHNELERMKSKKLIFSNKFASYHFDSITKLSGYELVDTVRKAVESLYKNPNIEEPIRRLYERSYLQVNDPRVLSLLINEINKIDINNIDMGDFYEHMLAVLGTQKEAGQFRTPRHLIKFIVDVVDPKIGERVLDPACGTAGFLTAAYIHIRNDNTSKKAKKSGAYLDKLNLDQRKFLLNKTIYGYDIDPSMIKFAISNLYLHNIKNPNISQHNTLTSNDGWEEKYDVILTNPPFSTPRGGVKPTDRFTLNSKRTEVLFVEYIIEHLTLNGRAGVIVPDGIINTQQRVYKELRKWLVEDNYLYSVVSLPSGVFNPYSGVNTSILFIDRELAHQTDKILFCKMENDGFDLGAQRRPIDKNDLPIALKIIKAFQKDSKKTIQEIYKTIAGGTLAMVGSSVVGGQDRIAPKDMALLVDKKKIIESGDYNLSGERYRERKIAVNQEWEMVKLEDVCDFIGGFAFKSKELVDIPMKDYLPVIKIGNLNKDGTLSLEKIHYVKYLLKLHPYLIKNNDILIAMTGATVGKVAFSNKRGMLLNQRVGLIRSNNKNLMQSYLKNILLTKKFYNYCQKIAGGGAQGNISPTQIKKYKIPLPPLSVQQKIVDELDGYQKIIDGAKQVIDNYKPQIKIDPAWKMVSLGELFEKRNNTIDPKTHKGNVNYIGLKNIASNTGKIVGEIVTDASKIKSLKNKFIDGDILYGKLRPNLNKVYFAEINGICSTDIMVLRSKSKKKASSKLYSYCFRDNAFNKQVMKGIRGAQLPRISFSHFSLIKIPLIPYKVQNKLIKKIEEEQKLIEANKKLIQLFEQKIKDKIEEVWGEKN